MNSHVEISQIVDRYHDAAAPVWRGEVIGAVKDVNFVAPKHPWQIPLPPQPGPCRVPVTGEAYRSQAEIVAELKAGERVGSGASAGRIIKQVSVVIVDGGERPDQLAHVQADPGRLRIAGGLGVNPNAHGSSLYEFAATGTARAARRSQSQSSARPLAMVWCAAQPTSWRVRAGSQSRCIRSEGRTRRGSTRIWRSCPDTAASLSTISSTECSWPVPTLNTRYGCSKRDAIATRAAATSPT